MPPTHTLTFPRSPAIFAAFITFLRIQRICKMPTHTLQLENPATNEVLQTLAMPDVEHVHALMTITR